MENTEEKTNELPHNLEAEQSLLGALLLDNECLEEVGDILLPSYFYSPVHSRIYQSIVRLIDNKQLASPVTLKNHFEHDGDLSEVGGAAYLNDLAINVSSLVNVQDYATMIKDLYTRRQLVHIGEGLVKESRRYDIETPASNLIESSEKELYDLAEKGESKKGFTNLTDAITQAINTAEEAYQKEGGVSGLSSGLVDLDKKIGGFHPSALNILAGATAMGKTSLAVNIAFNAVKNGAKVAFFSLEMSAEELGARILSDAARVPSHKMRKGDLDDRDFTAFTNAVNTLMNADMYIDDTPGISLPVLRSRARRLQRTKGLDMIVVDYLQLMTTGSLGRQEARHLEIAEISRGLKGLAKELSIPVIALAQLNRGVSQREDKRPMLSDLRESGSIEQDADVVMFVHREEYYLQREEPKENEEKYAEKLEKWQIAMSKVQNKAEVIIAKQRHGPVGAVHLFFDGRFTKFDNLEQSHDL
ncbi:MAG: replicative DNA helicase [Alphaproteobacteria bacterium]|jgi:replicative DNA helicase|nr:replicative DNA helicase [Alphaproteobacteria bacterium]